MRACTKCGSRFLQDEPFCPQDGSPTEEVTEVKGTDPLLGTTVDGRYRVDRQIGEGGMGIVYLATHAVLNKRLALKVLRGEMARDSDVVQRFVQEAQSATSIGHENIIDISDFGRLPDGSVYFVMEYLDGEALTELIKRGGSIPTHDAVRIIRQIASALGAAHARGIVHRDMKPDNVYLVKRPDGSLFVKVLDFGIAKVGGGSAKLTRTGMIFGTPHYMSPEQAAGQSVDQRTDIYALGVIMYEMFTGRVPFDADTFMGILTKHMFESPVPPSQAGDNRRLGALEDVILKALTKKPELRYQSMEELLGDLDTISSGGSIAIGSATGITPPSNLADALEPPSRTEMRLGRGGGGAAGGSSPPLPVRKGSPVALIAIGAVLVLGGGGVAAMFLAGGGGEPTSAQPPSAPASPPPIASAPPTTPGAGPGATPLPPVPALPLPQLPTPPAPSASVQIASDPPGAQVLLEGSIIGNTPTSLPRPTTTDRVLELKLPGYRSESVRVTGGSPESIAVTLSREATSRGRPRPAVERPAAAPEPTPQPPRQPRGIGSEVVDPWGN